MMAYERSESAQDNFGKFIHQFQSETKAVIRKIESILIKLYRQNVSLLFNQTYIHILYTHNTILCMDTTFKIIFIDNRKSNISLNLLEILSVILFISSPVAFYYNYWIIKLYSLNIQIKWDANFSFVKYVSDLCHFLTATVMKKKKNEKNN